MHRTDDGDGEPSARGAPVVSRGRPVAVFRGLLHNGSVPQMADEKSACCCSEWAYRADESEFYAMAITFTCPEHGMITLDRRPLPRPHAPVTATHRTRMVIRQCATCGARQLTAAAAKAHCDAS